MVAFLAKMTSMFNALISMTGIITNYMIADVLMAFCLAMMIFHFIIKFLRKLKHTF